MSPDPAVEAALESGQIVTLDLIRFELPGGPFGYHMGGRPYPHNGLVYKPNRWLSMGEMRGDLGVAVSTRELVFSNVPVDDPDDAIAKIEEFSYLNAPVIITHLLGEPDSNNVLGILASHLYEINQVLFEDGAAGANGERTLTMTVELEPPGRSARGATHVRRAQAEQQFDNDPTDTGLEYVNVASQWPREWGQVYR
ncbi:DUF2163 domain-containing protein [Chelativorans sp. ZYF759]|uniref:DUF2163 domain-containing protein n=1 Tax=Chelativorans sp. ZYF759 TaxID=2692213 RepID=UPI00145D6F2E|nr:DUF2163 domain-containing protein [Chelativorans sp. ZYF759]NMG39880.1 DUF2163 domain-containing protein [Chelativorans sp. ZYF759]